MLLSISMTISIILIYSLSSSMESATTTIQYTGSEIHNITSNDSKMSIKRNISLPCPLQSNLQYEVRRDFTHKRPSRKLLVINHNQRHKNYTNWKMRFVNKHKDFYKLHRKGAYHGNKKKTKTMFIQDKCWTNINQHRLIIYLHFHKAGVRIYNVYI